MNKYLPEYRTNSYIDKMFCINCQKCSTYDKDLCTRCGKSTFGCKTINAYTPTIPPKIDYSYMNAIFPSNYPYIYYYGSVNARLINYC